MSFTAPEPVDRWRTVDIVVAAVIAVACAGQKKRKSGSVQAHTPFHA